MRQASLKRAGSPRIVRDGLWVSAGQAGTMVATLVGVKILTTLMPPEAYGRMVLLLGLAALGSGVCCLPSLQAAMRFYPDAARDEQVNTLRALVARYLVLGVGCAASLLLAGGGAWTLWTRTGTWLAYALAGAFLAADVVRSFEVSLLNAARRQKDFALRNGLDAWAKPLGATAAVLALGPSATSGLLGYLAGSAAVSLLLRRRVVRDPAVERSSTVEQWARRTRAPFVRYAMPLAPLALLNWITSLSDRYILAGHHGDDAAGIYAAVYGLGSQPFIVINNLIHATLRPVLYDAVARGDLAKERRTLWIWLGLVLSVSGGGFLGAWLLAAWITRLLLGQAYWGGATLLPWIAGAYALQNIQQTFEIMMFAHGWTRRVVVLQAISAATALTLYVILIPALGAKGAAVGTLISFCVTCVVGFLLAGAHRRLAGRAP